MNKFEAGLQKAGKGVLTALESPVKLEQFLARGVKVLEDAVTAEPEVKTVLSEIVSQSVAIGAAAGTDVAEKGLNVVDDFATLQKIEAFAKYVETTVVPLVEKLYGEVKTDSQS